MICNAEKNKNKLLILKNVLFKIISKLSEIKKLNQIKKLILKIYIKKKVYSIIFAIDKFEIFFFIIIIFKLC